MAKFYSGTYIPINKYKMLSNAPITYRSSWEVVIFRQLDKHPNVLKWGSEVIKIPYFNPFKNTNTVYIPDLLVVYIDEKGNTKGEIMEIKPAKETFIQLAKTKKDKLTVALNTIKWGIARIYAEKNGLGFRILTELDIFKKS
jgi:hypothetical protein